MKITSRASDYALLLLMHLGRSNSPQDPISVKKVAETLKLSLRFLANIANKLVIARILISNRGLGGGLKLGRSVHAITVKDVIEAVDGPIQTMFCQNTHELCSHQVLCEMKPFWDDIQGTVIDKLATTTIAHLIEKKPQSLELEAHAV